MARGLALDHAAWTSPWRTRSVRDKGLLSLGLMGAAITLPPVPGGVGVAAVAMVLLLGPIGVGWARLGRLSWLPGVSILMGAAAVAVSIRWENGVQFLVTADGLTTAGGLAIRASATTLAMFTLACSTPMVDLFAALRRARVPDALIEIASLIYRFTTGLLVTAGAIHEAQAVRLGFATRSATMRSASLGTSALLVRSWDQARRLEAGLIGRGYEDTLRTVEPTRRRSTRFLLASLVTVAVLVAGSAAWPVSR